MVNSAIPDKSTELQILEAAREVFLEKGFDGARMQEIANKAGINKALLHYYFRTKEKLFMGIFVEAIGQLIPRVQSAVQYSTSFRDLVTIFVHSYHDIMEANPYLPVFVVREINRMPELVVDMMKNKGFDVGMIKMIISFQVSQGNIRPVDPVQFLISLIGQCIFPFIGMPLLKGVLLENSHEAAEKLMLERREFVIEFVLKGLDYVEEK
ncbi:MAG: TetR/AcrR family transcriptional regulator [Bacteroidetes bacterium HGW-Bacteroidetes-6]|jgi:AcrR family transcriptional regulator|nr:MAG: TetR/AcrR family transcriptional regulator [Bacteroidetes bacterium HGW-Bacteroidetes-6]